VTLVLSRRYCGCGAPVAGLTRMPAEPVLGVADAQAGLELVAGRVQQELGGVIGDASQHRDDGLDEAAVVHWLC